MQLKSTLLVVDSDISIRTVIRDILSSHGYLVTGASDLASAAVVLADAQPDLVLFALESGPDGNDSMARIAGRLDPSVPMVLLVDAVMDDPVAAVTEHGALAYLPKPIDRSRLLATVKQGLDARRLMVRLREREAELVHEQAFMQSMTDSSENDVLVLDRDGLVIRCGQRPGSLPLPRVDSACGKPYLSLLPEAAVELHEGLLARARAAGEPVRIEEHRMGGVMETVVAPVMTGGQMIGYIVTLRDITARRKNETGLAEREKQYRSVFEGAVEAILLVDRNTSLILAINRSALTALGYAREELLGKSIEDLAVRSDKVLAMLRKGTERTAYESLRRKDGSMFPVELSLSYFSNAGREAVVIYAQDVSRRKIAEEALREGARLYRAVVEDQTELICRYDLEGRLTFVNSAHARFFGEDEDEAVGRDCFSGFSDADRLRLTEWLKRADSAEPVLDCEVSLTRTDGAVRWIQWTNRALINERRVVVEIQAVGRDVTERKDAERALDAANAEKEQYRRNLVATFKSIPDAILTVDTDLVIVASNSAAATLFSFDQQRMRGIKLEEVVSGKGNPCVSVLKQVLRTDKPVRGYEIELATPSLGNRMVEINCSPLVGQNRHHEGAVLVVRDVSRVADLEKKLQQRHGFRGIVGASAAMQDIYGLLEQLSPLDSIVLILGESGTGKELVAEALHYGGPRAGKPLIKVNCSALSESLLESELFGHIKGAFTGAVRDKVGRIQAAEGGTLFLDEIGDISPLIQLKLLRFLEQKEFERVGDTKTLSADVRIIAATNVNLPKAVHQGIFREDLYYRLNVMPVHLPSLRERQADIPLLVEHFLAMFSDQFSKSFESVSEEVMDLFMGYRWPGNVRELRHALEHACILSPGKSVTLRHIRKDLVEQAYAVPVETVPGVSPHAPFFPQRRKPGREEILTVLAQCGGNKAQAARRLGIHRATLYRKLKAWEVES